MCRNPEKLFARSVVAGYVCSVSLNLSQLLQVAPVFAGPAEAQAAQAHISWLCWPVRLHGFRLPNFK